MCTITALTERSVKRSLSESDNKIFNFCCGCIFFFFFFSSRRRHTRCSRDWSSDVCSSDLGWTCSGLPPSRPRMPASWASCPSATYHEKRAWIDCARASASAPSAVRRSRSEERRVGKSVELGGRRVTKKENEKRKRKW